MQPFPTEPTPDDLTGLDQPDPPDAVAPGRVPGRIQLGLLGRGHTIALGAVCLVLVASFLPWYHAHVAPAPGGSLTDPCPPALHGTDRQICEDESRAEEGVAINHLTWAAWNTPRAWLPILLLMAFGAVLVRQMMPEYRLLPKGGVIVGLVAVMDLACLQALVWLPSPGPDLDGHTVPGSQAWRLDWGVYLLLAGLLAMTIGIAVDYVRSQQRSSPHAAPDPPAAPAPATGLPSGDTADETAD